MISDGDDWNLPHAVPRDTKRDSDGRGSPRELLSHYRAKYAGRSADEVGAAHISPRPRSRFEAVAGLVRPGHALLEVGAGSGEVLLAVAEQFDEIVALELTPDRAAILRRVLFGCPVTVIEGAIEDGLPYSEGHFDTIILNDVVEHLVEPFGVLAYLRGLLAPGGRLVLHSPNVATASRRVRLLVGRFPSTSSWNEGLTDWGGRPTTALDDAHLHYFTWRSMTLVLKDRAGFREVEWHGYGSTRLGRWCPGLADTLGRRWPTLFSDICLVASA